MVNITYLAKNERTFFFLANVDPMNIRRLTLFHTLALGFHSSNITLLALSKDIEESLGR